MTPEDRKELSEEWKGLVSAVDSKGKFDVQNNGVCLLLACTIEVFTRGLASTKSSLLRTDERAAVVPIVIEV
jgi:hypothetical protein